MGAALHIHHLSILHVHINVFINFSASFPTNTFCSSYPVINSYHWIFWQWWVSGLTLAFSPRTGSQVNTRTSATCVSLKQFRFRFVSHVELDWMFWKKSLVCLFMLNSLRISCMYTCSLKKGELIKKKINIFFFLRFLASRDPIWVISVMCCDCSWYGTCDKWGNKNISHGRRNGGWLN